MKCFHNLTAYMLGNEKYDYTPGEQWWPFDTRVWLCQNMAIAEKILHKSQQQTDGAVWTDIYRVTAKDIICEQSNRGLLYTNTPTKIFVEKKVLCREPTPNFSEETLLKNAKQISPVISNFMKSWEH